MEENILMNRLSKASQITASWLGMMVLILSGCSSEPAKMKVAFRVVTEKGDPMEEIQITFLSKDRKYAEMSQSVGGGLGSVMLFPSVYGVGVNKYEGGKSIQGMAFGSEEYKFAMEKFGGNIPSSNILPAELEDPLKSGIEVTVKPGMEALDIVVKGVENGRKNPPNPAGGKGNSQGGAKEKAVEQPVGGGLGSPSPENRNK